MGHLLASNSGPLVSEEKKLHSSQELVNLMTTFPSFTFSCFISISKRFENFPEKLIPTYSIWRSSWRTTLTTQTMTTWCTTTSQHLSFQKLRGSVMTQKIRHFELSCVIFCYLSIPIISYDGDRTQERV